MPPARGRGARGDSTARQVFRKKLREGELDDKEIEIDLAEPKPQLEIMGPPGMEDMTEQLKGMFGQIGGAQAQDAQAEDRRGDEAAGRRRSRPSWSTRTRSSAARITNAEQNGIVFIDEIDKVTSRSEGSGAEVSRQGVQRDLLPLVEGTTVSTKYGPIKTDHILFIASGAFHLAKPSDLIPELQGRFPIRVELGSLSVQDFEAILTPRTPALVKQYQALLATENVHAGASRPTASRGWRRSPST
jgi:ATP-dependent HslUV protease ATP-binding subunit HslU